MGVRPRPSRIGHRKIQKWESAASAALLATAAFAAAPRSARAVISVTAGDQSWFNTSIWSINFSTVDTGTLPEVAVQTGADTGVYVDLDSPNTVMPAQGILFDPANDAGTPGGKNANYLADVGDSTHQFTFYVSNAVGLVTGFQVSAPNKLTIESGTIETWWTTIGRDGQGIIVQNGGVFMNTGGKLAIQGSKSTETLGSGTYEYHGGTLIAGNQLQVASSNDAGGVGSTSAGVGRFVVYNDGPDGAILASNGMTIGANTSNAGTIGIVEFHYDLNTHDVGNVRPVQDDFNTTTGALRINNGNNRSARLNILLDAVPTVTNGQVQNLGLFAAQQVFNDTTTSPAIFYSLDGLTAFTQGATIAAAYSGIAYSWTISYSGVISFDNTATSAYTSSDISALGGTDVVLVGIPVPEPASIALLGGAASMILARRNRRKISK
jgi:hypothetical protein